MPKTKGKRGSKAEGLLPRPKSAAHKKEAKYQEEADNIVALQEGLGVSQSKFAEMLNVARSRIPAWESGAECPSPEAFLELGRLAGSNRTLRNFFWQRSGRLLDLARIVGEKLLREGGQPIPTASVVSVPCLRRVGRQTERTEQMWPVKGERVANLGSTQCLLIDEGASSHFLRAGDAVVLDTSDANSQDLRPFLDQIVLVDIDANKPRSLDPDRQMIHWPDGLCIGRLRLKVHWNSPLVIPVPGQRTWLGEINHITAGAPLWLATLTGAGDMEQDWEPGGSSVYLGAWTPHTSPAGLGAGAWQAWLEECAREAPGSIRLEDGCSILGRVIDWSPHIASGQLRSFQQGSSKPRSPGGKRADGRGPRR